MRRRMLGLVAAVVALACGAGSALAQTTPARMPRLIGMSRTQALLTLFKLHTAPRTIDPPSGDGTVLGQAPLPGEPLTAQTDITLNLASLPPPGSSVATMPKVVGMPLDDAVRRLGKSKLRINSVQAMVTDAALPGEIVGQEPSIGAAVGADAQIDLYVAQPTKAGTSAAKHGGFSAAALALTPPVTPQPTVARQSPPAWGEAWLKWTLWAGIGSAGTALLAVFALIRGAGSRRQLDRIAEPKDTPSVQLLRAADRLAVPWKNGGGVTREIVAWPPGADVHNFDWRVSMASVETGGPFSHFPAVDRVLHVLEGELVLTIDEGEELKFNEGSGPAIFSGDAAVLARTLSAVVSDLNVMTRRGRASATVSRWRDVAAPWPTPADWTLLLCRRDGLTVRAHGQALHLSQDDALLFTGRDTADIRMESNGGFDLYVISINS